MAASARFHLAECHRKLDHKEEAAQYCRQLLADFPAEENLAKLARENLVAVGEEPPTDGTATAMNAPGLSAEEQAKIDRVQRLLGVHPVDLNNAPKNGHLKVAALLLDQGLDGNKAASKESALGLAALEGHLSMVDFLLERGARIDIQPENDLNTPLIEAIYYNRNSVVKRLLEKNADPNLRSSSNDNALSEACDVGSVQIVAWLLEAGTDVNAEATGKPIPEPKLLEFERIEVKLSELMVNEDAGKRRGPDLQPGVRIEIPASENAEGDWTGLSEDMAAFLQEQTKANVTLSVLGQADREVLLAPTFPVYESQFGLATLKDAISPLGAAVDADTHWLAPALSNLGYTKNKYELGKIEMISQITDKGIDAEGRGVSATRSGSPRYFDLKAPTPPVWLRAGDTIGFRAKDEPISPTSDRRRVVLPPLGGR